MALSPAVRLTGVVFLAVAYAAAVAEVAFGRAGADAGGRVTLRVSALEVFVGFAAAVRAPAVAAWAAARSARKARGGGGGGGGGVLDLLAGLGTAWAVAKGVREVARDGMLFLFVLFGLLRGVEWVASWAPLAA